MLIDKVLPLKIESIFLDMDDTLLDFIGQAARTLMYPGRKILSNTEIIEFCDWFAAIEDEEKWGLIRTYGAEWWTNLPKLPWCDELIEVSKQICPENTYILTSPAPFPESAAGKAAWVEKNFERNKLIMTKSKEVCAKEGRVLIDDYEKWGNRWKEEGGTYVKVSRIWNVDGFSSYKIIEGLKRYYNGQKRSL